MSKRSHFDVVVVGTGMGGSTIGHVLAASGCSLLFLEQSLNLMLPGIVCSTPTEALPEFAAASEAERQMLLERSGGHSEVVGTPGDPGIE